ncbi:MAG: acetyl-CoA carboxylase biotin carboxylase subunit [Candidatus Zixiibacteriota bacterium]
MIKRVLVANRGEIALRVIRACKELGIHSVAVYSKADTNSLHNLLADEAICIGGNLPSQSYLDPRNIMSTAIITNVDAIHPGYGFLAENAEFAEMCESHNIKFIGPTAKMIRQMGDKATAKEIMKNAGVPTVPGSEGILSSYEEAKKLAIEIGLPVIFKATAGGGGRGMRLVRHETEIHEAFIQAQAEAESAFGNPGVYVEKFIENPKHIEVQLLGDGAGEVIHLGERDCSVQRRHQKLIEECPSTVFNSKTRDEVGRMAAKAASIINFEGAGTIEFLMDKDGNIYFIEMNTRIQVEHPVTEMVVGLDLVKAQLLVAAGEGLPALQESIRFNGYALECRINAEDPDYNYAPSPGRITSLHIPGGFGVRVDTHAYAGYVVPSYYDSMIAKLITHGNTRDEARLRMQRALDEFIIEGVKTTLPIHKKILREEDFIRGNYDTSFLQRFEKSD